MSVPLELVTRGTAPGSTLVSAELDDAIAGKRASTGSIAAARSTHVETVRADSSVLVAGGENQFVCDPNVCSPRRVHRKRPGNRSCNGAVRGRGLSAAAARRARRRIAAERSVDHGREGPATRRPSPAVQRVRHSRRGIGIAGAMTARSADFLQAPAGPRRSSQTPEVVEAGGIEPPSASATRQDLHAYPVYCSHAGLPDRQGKPDASSVLFNAVLPETRAPRDPVIATLSRPAQARRGAE